MQRSLLKFLVTGFLEKNRDTFSADLLQLIHNTSNKFLQQLFVEDIGKDVMHCRLHYIDFQPSNQVTINFNLP